MPPAVMLLIIVVAAGLITMFVMNQMGEQTKQLEQQKAEYEAKMSQKATAVYATKDIPEGSIIASDAVEERQMEAGKKPEDALDSAMQAAGRTVKYPISAGSIISARDLAPIAGSTGFEAKIRDGNRAVTFGVDSNSGVAGFIAPGSHVDIVCVVGSGRETKASPILSDVEVIAVGGVYQRSTTTTATPSTSVTVGVNPGDADKLIKAMKAGSLYLTLRNQSDHSPVAVVDVTSLFEKPASRNDVASLPPPPAALPPLPGGGGPGGGGFAPIKPIDHEVEQWQGSAKETKTVPKD